VRACVRARNFRSIGFPFNSRESNRSGILEYAREIAPAFLMNRHRVVSTRSFNAFSKREENPEIHAYGVNEQRSIIESHRTSYAIIGRF
jgi:hypothetical protein